MTVTIQSNGPGPAGSGMVLIGFSNGMSAYFPEEVANAMTIGLELELVIEESVAAEYLSLLSPSNGLVN